jgi:hypothetical protein
MDPDVYLNMVMLVGSIAGLHMRGRRSRQAAELHAHVNRSWGMKLLVGASAPFSAGMAR